VGRHVCKKLGLKYIAQEKTDHNFQLTKWNKKRSVAQMTKLYAEGLKNYEKQTESKEQQPGERRSSNEPTKEGRHPNEPKSNEKDVQIIEVKEESKSADPTEKSVDSAFREKSISSDKISRKVIENAKNDKISHASTDIKSVRDNKKTASNCVDKSQKMAEEQSKDNKSDACVENKETCVRDSNKNINEQLINTNVQKSANEQFKNIKSNDSALELSASDQIKIVQCEPYSIYENTN